MYETLSFTSLQPVVTSISNMPKLPGAVDLVFNHCINRFFSTFGYMRRANFISIIKFYISIVCLMCDFKIAFKTANAIIKLKSPNQSLKHREV